MSNVMPEAAVVSSTTPTLPADALSRMSDTERSHWRLTGEFPADAPAGAPAADDPSSPEAESAPAAPAEQATSTDVSAPPASEPGTPKKSNAETRKAELTAEIKALLRQRDALREELAPPKPPAETPTTEAKPAPLATAIEHPDPASTALPEDAFFAQYPQATVGDYARYLARYEIARVRAEESATRDRDARLQTFKTRLDAVLKDEPEFWSQQHPRVRALPTLDQLRPGETPTALHYAGQEILLAERPADLIRYLSEHPEELDRIQTGSWADGIRAIARISAQLDRPSVPEPVTPRPTTAAPPVPTTLGSKPAVSVDDAEGAVAAGDFRRYRSAMNRKEGAS